MGEELDVDAMLEAAFEKNGVSSSITVVWRGEVVKATIRVTLHNIDYVLGRDK